MTTIPQDDYPPLSRSQTFAGYGARRPSPRHTALSFSQLDPSKSSKLERNQASSSKYLHTASEAMGLENGPKFSTRDIFEKKLDSSTTESTFRISAPLKDTLEDLDELPIELVSLIDRFIDSLGAKVHSTPPSAEKLSHIFQQFYLTAATHVSTHIQALSSLQSRETFPNPSTPPKTTNVARDSIRSRLSFSAEAAEVVAKAPAEQQMLTPQEISDRRRARRLLEVKGLALEEAVEKKVCERIYSRIWRHRSTLDEVRDEKLRSRTAALALVGIGLPDLGVQLKAASLTADGLPTQAELQAEDWISKAKESILGMNNAQYPLGKLNHLVAAHKFIVELLTNLHQSSSSADEILPTLIYALITTPPESINVISDLHFIQRFRGANKINGEASYCLTNLEAAITFLETVDLASLRSDEALEGPRRSLDASSIQTQDGPNNKELKTPHRSQSTPVASSASNMLDPGQPNSLQGSHPPDTSGAIDPKQSMSSSNPGRPNHQFQSQPNTTRAVRDAAQATTDQGFKNIGSALDNSLKVIFGRLKNQPIDEGDVSAQRPAILPRTLDEARMLIDPESNHRGEEESVSGASSTTGPMELPSESRTKTEDKLLGIVAGRRDRSADSAQSSGSSSKRVAFAVNTDQIRETAGSPSQRSASDPSTLVPPPLSREAVSIGNAAVESMRSLGNSLNPLNRFANMNVMRTFGKSSATGPSTATDAAPRTNKARSGIPEAKGEDVVKAAADSEGHPAQPPIPRFMDIANASELKIGEVEDLLRDYRRLASVLQKMDAFRS